MKKILTTFLVLLSLFVVVPHFSPVHAQQPWDQTKVCVGSDYGNLKGDDPTKPTSANDVATIAGVECIVANVLATVITLIGTVSFIMFLVGGFRYLTAGSNTKGVEAGKNAITFAILGIVVALASFLIVRTISVITGVNSITTFTIKQLPPGAK